MFSPNTKYQPGLTSQRHFIQKPTVTTSMLMLFLLFFVMARSNSNSPSLLFSSETSHSPYLQQQSQNIPTSFNKPDVQQSPLFSSETSDLLLLKTGTTIVGVCCKDGVVLGADTRSTGGPLVMDKNKLKIHTVAPFIFCCAAGTSADCDQLTRRAEHMLTLLRIERLQCGEDTAFDPLNAAIQSITSSLESGISASKRMPSSVMILGGVDDAGPALYMIDDSKVAQRLSFAALGSGSMDAIAVLEAARRQWQRKRRGPSAAEGVKAAVQIKSLTHGGEDSDIVNSNANYVEDIDIDTAIEATRQAVRAGILNDLGSGSHVDICVIQKSGVRRWRETMKSTWDSERLLTQSKQNHSSNAATRSEECKDRNGSLDTTRHPVNLGQRIHSSAKAEGLSTFTQVEML